MAATYHNCYKLTPMPSSNRWRKTYKGKTYYVGQGHCSNKADRVGYRIALEQWNKKKEELGSTPSEDE
jgi:hypothetical protein